MKHLLPLALTALLLTACAGTSPPTYFYTLEAASVEILGQKAQGPGIGLGPVILPDTLDRPQIVTRNGDYGIELAEFHRWAGGLRADMSRLMAARLMQQLDTERVSLYPWPRHRNLDYQVRVDVLRFDGQLGAQAVLEGSWTLLDGEGRKELRQRAFRFNETAAGTDYRAMVEAMSRLVILLVDDIAAQIKGM